MLFGELDHLGIDFDLGETFNGPMLQHLLGNAAVAAADDDDFARFAVGKKWHMRHHFLIDEFVPCGNLGRAVDHQHFAEERLFKQHQMLMCGLRLVKELVDAIADAKAEFVEQCLGDPALVGHDVPACSVRERKSGR